MYKCLLLFGTYCVYRLLYGGRGRLVFFSVGLVYEEGLVNMVNLSGIDIQIDSNGRSKCWGSTVFDITDEAIVGIFQQKLYQYDCLW